MKTLFRLFVLLLIISCFIMAIVINIKNHGVTTLKEISYAVNGYGMILLYHITKKG